MKRNKAEIEQKVRKALNEKMIFAEVRNNWLIFTIVINNLAENYNQLWFKIGSNG